MVGSVLAASLRFRVLLAGVAGGLIVAGVLSLPTMHADAVPELASGPVLEVQTEAPGLSSQEVEQYITVPMENNLLDGMMGVWDVRSQSTPGLSTVDLYFEPGHDRSTRASSSTERLTNSFSLPNVAKPPLLIQPLSSTEPRADDRAELDKSVRPLELSYLARWVDQAAAAGRAGVANVAIFGQQDRQIQVLVDPARLAAHHVTLQQVITRRATAQLVSPLTYLEGSAPGTGGFIDGPNQRLDIRPVLPLGAPKDLASGADLRRAGQAAARQRRDRRRGPPAADRRRDHGRRPGLVLLVQKLPSASVLGVTKGVERALSRAAPALQGVPIDTSFFKPASYVSSALHNLALALIDRGRARRSSRSRRCCSTAVRGVRHRAVGRAVAAGAGARAARRSATR